MSLFVSSVSNPPGVQGVGQRSQTMSNQYMNDPVGLGVNAGARPEPGWFDHYREAQPWHATLPKWMWASNIHVPWFSIHDTFAPEGRHSSVALFGNGANGGATRLWFAAREFGSCDAIHWLLAQGADIEVGNPSTGSTPLHGAAIKGSVPVAALLLDEGARVDACDKKQHHALHFAASYGHREMMRFLLDSGHPLDAPDHRGDDAEAVARANNQPEVADFLADIRAAGGWRKYTLAPRVRLLALHKALPALQKAKRATLASVPVHECIFASEALPKELVWKILSYWRSERDCPAPVPDAPLGTFWANQPNAHRDCIAFPV